MNSCTIPLTNGKGVTVVDSDDFDRLSQFNWGVDRYGYVRRMIWADKKKVSIYMHREILPSEGKETIDHINRDRRDNRKSNLRIATQAQNNANRGAKKNKRGDVKFLGVHKNTKGTTYSAIFRGKHLGSFRDPEAAARCYDAAAREFFGEFAAQNFADAG